ncbi:hypothetical protein [Pseudonocardia acidicola]|uniref:Uncharacterized protein n=1 Tax=Pseudonocardia acidicola TaxID=2724939 RepID=A0ABX1S7C1_9PSEU|nr:hypothetical protein [Pseudonocardia acidicola]NMH97436.1 hypothetical protein [Pseudonocardia acidicola]
MSIARSTETNVTCAECGDTLLDERAELGYDYCTKPDCQAKRHRGLTITAIGVNKSADSFIVADEDEIRRRAETGEFAKKDTNLGIGYRAIGPRPAAQPTPQPRRPVASVRRPPARRTWSPEQEKIVRLYHDMGLRPAQIVERAGRNTPRLGITAALVTKILSSNPAR